MQGFNMGRYVPPDLEGTTSFNQASGKGHALGHRARKLKTEGILTVRFECPFAIWCTTCVPEQIIGQGVRFNAEKKKVGAYYSTPVWQFRFKHVPCGGWVEVRTDPQNAEYIVTEGGRRRDTGADKVLDGEIRLGVSEDEKARFEREGGFGAVEKKVEDKSAFVTQQERLSELRKASDRAWRDPYAMNRKLRAEFRVGRRKRQADERTGEALKEKFALDLDMEVLAEAPEDGERVKFVEFGDWAAAEASASSSSSSKPLFASATYNGDLPSRPKHSQKSGGAGPGKGGGGGGVRAKQDDTKKQVLQGQWASNTRMATDPFLRELDVWQPRAKRKREVHEEEEEEEGQEGGAEIVDGGEAKKVTKVTKATKGVNNLALVGYGSDSDSDL
ncbi:Protein saf4 [Rhinocladiella similis]